MRQPSLFQAPSEWIPPENIPNLEEAAEIAIDLETHDPGLKTTGPGWATKKGKVIGVALAVEGWKGYFPLAHPGGGNFDIKVFTRQLKKILDLPCDKIFHNAIYDIGWLSTMGLEVKGRIIDTMIAAPLIDENRRNYSLKEVAQEYIGETKSEAGLYEAAKDFGVDAKAEMHLLPAMYVGPYAEQDAAVTLKLWQTLKVEIIKQELTSVFNLESELLPILFQMKKRGVRVDIEKAERVKKDFKDTEKKILHSIHKECGFEMEILSPLSIQKAFDKLKISYNRTATGLPSFDKNFLLTHSNPFAQKIVQAREMNKAHTTFIDSILKHAHKGRIHADVNQLRSDTGGTISGRLSMQNPNLQQIPARNPKISPKIRQLFIPEEGQKWGIFDYSQQEPRLLIHYGALVSESTSWDVASVEKLLNDYNNKPNTDFHQIVADMAQIPRKQAKTINLGMMYGMGKGKLMSELGLDKDDIDKVFKQYHSTVPFIKELTDRTMRRASEKGYIRTIMGRKCRFHLWEPNHFGVHKALPREQAEVEYGGMNKIKRAWTYKALNRLIQGSAADQTKMAMVKLYKEGFLPMIQVHDELDMSFSSEEEKKKIIEIMEHALDLRVPSKVDAEIGPSWGEAINNGSL
jgi:DNA polymerase I-like protein with 3'-5' exonuclease and polymerase domains